MGPALIGAGAALLGGVLGNQGAAAANRANRREAQKNRAFQERMRNTQWQAAVADMEAAGINPALAYAQGAAASPGGSLAAPAQDELGAGVSSALQVAQVRKQMALLDSQIKKTKAEAGQAEMLEAWEKERAKFFGILNRSGIRNADGSVYRGTPDAHKLFQAQIDKALADVFSAQSLGQSYQAQAGLAGLDLSILSKMGGLPRILQMLLRR